MLVRTPFARIAEREGTLLVIGNDRSTLRLTGDSAALARALLGFLAEPRSRDQLLAHLTALSGEPIKHAEVVDELLSLLVTAGALRDDALGKSKESISRPPQHEPRLVLGICGAIGAAHTPQLVEFLLEQRFDVQIAATRTALRMVSREALEALTHRPLHSSLWGADPTIPAPHIQLAEWAEAVLVCPATATTLSRIAHGDCSDLVSAVVVSTRAPILVAPSMNPAMLDAPSVQRNLEQLRQDGIWLVNTASGLEVAHAPSARRAVWGAAPSPEAVVQLLRAVLSDSGA